MKEKFKKVIVYILVTIAILSSVGFNAFTLVVKYLNGVQTTATQSGFNYALNVVGVSVKERGFAEIPTFDKEGKENGKMTLTLKPEQK